MTTEEKNMQMKILSNKMLDVKQQIATSYTDYLSKNKELNAKLQELNKNYLTLSTTQVEDIPQIKQRVIAKINNCNNLDLLKQLDNICADNTPELGTKVWGFKAFRSSNGHPCRMYYKTWDDIYSERGLKDLIRLCYKDNSTQTLSLHIVQLSFPKKGINHYNKAFFATKEEAYNKAIEIGIPEKDIKIIE